MNALLDAEAFERRKALEQAAAAPDCACGHCSPRCEPTLLDHAILAVAIVAFILIPGRVLLHFAAPLIANLLH